jgi:hypothetical protein
VTFHIGRQSGGVINNVGRDQHISGGQHGALATTGQVRQALRDLGEALAATSLDEETAAAARAEVAELDAAAAAAVPDRPRFAAALDRLTRLLTAAGSLASAGSALAGPQHALAAWIGAVA